MGTAAMSQTLELTAVQLMVTEVLPPAGFVLAPPAVLETILAPEAFQSALWPLPGVSTWLVLAAP
jgi:hypothetical protein